MQDQETATYWSHITGEALIGKLEGKQLSTIPSVQTIWSEWSGKYPTTKVLKKDREIGCSQYEEYFMDPDKTGLFKTKWLKERLPAKKLVYGVTLGPHAMAVPDNRLSPGEFLDTQMGEEKVIVVRGLDGGVRAFVARAGKKTLTFRKEKKTGEYVDEQTGSVWDLEPGICQSGKLKGQELQKLTVTKAFWFAWSNFHPETAVVD